MPTPNPAPPQADAAAFLLCGGSGRRLAGAVADKVLAPLAGRPAAAWSAAALLAGGVGQLVVTFRDEAQRDALAAVLPPGPHRLTWVRGGAERADSVAHALAALPEGIAYVLIHDAARPLLRAGTVARLLAARPPAAVCARPVADTIKRAQPPPAGTAPASAPAAGPFALQDLDRAGLWAMETPQAFARGVVAAGYAELRRQGARVTDDAAAVALTGQPVALWPLPYPNPKLTTPADLPLLEFLLRAAGPAAGPFAA